MRLSKILAGLAWVCVTTAPVFAADLGDFTASTTCPAMKSINTGENPGNVKVKPGKSYPATQLNKPGGEYVSLRIDGANPPQRWVRVDCGQLAQASPSPTPPAPAASRENLLALSWQPAFCDIHERNVPECRNQTTSRFDATHFTLHGLWPQPEGNYYCHGVSNKDKANDKNASKWHLLPSPPGLTDATLAKLAEAMPGVASDLHRHEWIKHGTCFGADNADAYFRTALALQSQVNNSQLQKTMAAHIDKPVSVAELSQAFEQSFGPGSAAALQIDCKQDTDSHRNLVVELQFKLKGDLTETTPLAEALDKSHPEQSDTCRNAVVDPAGY